MFYVLYMFAHLLMSWQLAGRVVYLPELLLFNVVITINDYRAMAHNNISLFTFTTPMLPYEF